MSVHTLSGTFLSVLGSPERLAPRSFGDRSLAIYQCRTAVISRLFNYVRDWNGDEAPDSALYGAACEVDPVLAELKALGEAAERYTSAVLDVQHLRVASADALGPEAFQWHRLPSLSDAERQLPGQGLAPFSPNATMRWLPAMDMATGLNAYLPVVMTHLYPRAWTSERFTYPISTGTALHPDPRRAILSAVLEVIERDALSLNWILRRPLRRIQLSPTDRTRFDATTWELLQRRDILLYEATTDIGMPVVYARRHRPAHPRCANVFGCACDANLVDAIGKAAREAIMISHALEGSNHIPPKAPIDCTLIIDGACMMMAPERNEAFAFLDTGGAITLAALLDTAALPSPVDAQLDAVLDMLKAHDQPVYVTEISSDETLDVGLRAFRAVMPGMMPLSFVHSARFLGSRRLADAHRIWKLPAPLQDCINPWPQPFS